jgi:hypothetical protein
MPGRSSSRILDEYLCAIPYTLPGVGMANRQRCTDSLFLMGEMLNAAHHCVDLCDEDLAEDDIILVEEGCEQVDSLKRRSEDLVRRIGHLQERLELRLGRQNVDCALTSGGHNRGNQFSPKLRLVEEGCTPVRVRKRS